MLINGDWMFLHGAFDSLQIHFASERIDGDAVNFDLKVGGTLVERGVSGRGNNTAHVVSSNK